MAVLMYTDDLVRCAKTCTGLQKEFTVLYKL